MLPAVINTVVGALGPRGMTHFDMSITDGEFRREDGERCCF